MQSRGAAARLGLARTPGGIASGGDGGGSAAPSARRTSAAACRSALIVCDMTTELVGVLPKGSQTRLILSVNEAVEAAAQRGAAVIFTRIGSPATALGTAGGAGAGAAVPTITAAVEEGAAAMAGGPAAVAAPNAIDPLTFDLQASKNKLLLQLRGMGFLDPGSEGSKLHSDLVFPTGSLEIQKPRYCRYCCCKSCGHCCAVLCCMCTAGWWCGMVVL